jgi:hypothetical protein
MTQTPLPKVVDYFGSRCRSAGSRHHHNVTGNGTEGKTKVTGRITVLFQSNGGAVGGSTPQVQSAYANGSTNMIRPTTLTYPDGRAITIG